MDRNAQRAQLTSDLVTLIRKLSYKEGDFTLSSGEKSKFYVDLKNATLHPEAVYLMGELAMDIIQRDAHQVEALAGMTLGADPLITAISLAGRARGMFLPGAIVRKEAKGHGTGRYIEGAGNFKKGMKLLILEDVITTGNASMQAIERVREAGYDPIAALAVVDREQGGSEVLAAEGIKFFRLTTLKDIQAAK